MVLQGVCKQFGGQPVLQDFSLDLPGRGIVCFLGPSGCGKTTLFNCIAGLIPLDAGKILDRPSRIACIFQQDRLLPWASALGNVQAVLPRDKQADAQAMLQALGLSDALHKRPSELSGGMCRRVVIARALCYDAPLLLMDEPFKGLDRETKAVTMQQVAGEKDKRLVLMITHDESEAYALADRIERLEGPPLRRVLSE